MTKSSLPSSYPHSVKAGSVTVKIYKFRNGVGSTYSVDWRIGRRRFRKSFSHDNRALSFATETAENLSEGHVDATTISVTEAAIYRESARLLAGRAPVHVAVSEYVSALNRLNGRATLLEAVDFFIRSAQRISRRISVAEIVAEFIDSKDRDGVSTRYYRVLKNDLERFARGFPCPLVEVTTPEIAKWLGQLGIGARSRNNIRGMIISLFRYAKRLGYLPRNEATEAEFVPRALVRGGDIHIFSVEQLTGILKAADSDNLPFIVLSAFAGVRHAEVLRLEWADVRWEQECVVIGREKSKTATRRLVPLLPNAKAWLEPYRSCQGKIVRFAREQRRIQRKAGGLGIKWRQNVLRHSFISYRVAHTQNVPQVALEAGNSPQVIFSNYRELVTQKEAAQYFGLLP